ncbi:MAG: GNAT family N-acetyltransferase [Pseudomonadales bacterium]|nr:GNAT family N-acetyltransferase [Pseudomonadales bacterium]
MSKGSEMEITEILDSDVSIYAELYVHVFNSPPWKENWTLPSAIERLDFYRRTPGFIGFCVHERSSLVGFVLGNYEPYQQGKVYLLKEMCIAPERQRSGLGSSLLEKLHSALKERDICLINLITRIGHPAEGFYLKNNYLRVPSMGLYVAKLDNEH